jgi:hypothetical protein
MILPSSASQVAGITGMSHWCLAIMGTVLGEGFTMEAPGYAGGMGTSSNDVVYYGTVTNISTGPV